MLQVNPDFRLVSFAVKLSTSFVPAAALTALNKDLDFLFIWQSRTQEDARVCNLTLSNFLRLCRLPFFIYGKVLILRFSSLRKPIEPSEYQETEEYQWEQSPACELPTVMARKRFNTPQNVLHIYTGTELLLYAWMSENSSYPINLYQLSLPHQNPITGFNGTGVPC